MNSFLPENFNWWFYLKYHEDLTNAGLKDKEDAERHYLNHGQYENRIYDYKIVSKRDRSDFFFIHTYKNMGTTIMSQLPVDYNLRFYGYKSLSIWELENNEKIKKQFYNKEKIHIDHTKIDVLKDLGIIDDVDLNRKFIGIVREPLERFISWCNYENKTPNLLLELLSNKDDKTQCDSFETIYPIDLTLILMEEKNLIKDWFLNHGISLDLEKVENVSNKKITTLTDHQVEKIKSIFKKDFLLYNKLKKNSGILKMKGFNF